MSIIPGHYHCHDCGLAFAPEEENHNEDYFLCYQCNQFRELAATAPAYRLEYMKQHGMVYKEEGGEEP